MSQPYVVEVPGPHGTPGVVEVTGSAPSGHTVEVPAPASRERVVEVLIAGQQGPRGPEGRTFAASYIHEQTHQASQTWLVQHNLGYRPGGFHVTDLDGNDVEPVIHHISENAAMLTFYVPTAGTATIS